MIIAQDPNDLDENPTVFVFRADEGIVIQSAGKYIVIHDVDVGPFLDAVVDRLQELRQDALAEDQPMDLDSVTQFTGFLTHNPDIPSPKTITLTPDGTVRARWKGVPEASDHIAFEFKGGSYTTIRADFS